MERSSMISLDKKKLTITIMDGKLSHKYEGPWTRKDLEAAFKQVLTGLPTYIRDTRRQEEKKRGKDS